MKNIQLTRLTVLTLFTVLTAMSVSMAFGKETKKPIKVFILAGDENVLEQGMVEGRTSGIHQDFYPNATATKEERKKHVKCAVYKGAYDPNVDYGKMTPVVTGLVEIGEQRSKRADPKKRGRVAVAYTPFPELAMKDGYTTVLRGYLSVAFSGKYELLAGSDESAFNVTTVNGNEVYRRNMGQKTATVTAIQLEPKKCYAFETIFFGKPGHAFKVPLVNKPGTLTTVVSENPKYAFLKSKDGNWVERSDVVIYDAHPIHNNTEAPARPLRVGTKVVSGREGGEMMGVDLMLGQRLGDAFDEPVMILRFGTRHPIWFQRGSRDLSHDYRPPSAGGGDDLDGSWDVIHFNFGVWDAMYREASSKYFSGHNVTSVEDFEKNLRTLVAKMKKTGATIIWGSVTPVWPGKEGHRNADVDAFNVVAAKVMKENGVIINDLNTEVRRLGYPKTTNVHSVGDLSPKVTKTILEAISKRKTTTKPLPRVLLIGDSITGSYQKKVMSNLDGKASVFKNPGNAEDTWNGLERMDEWLDLRRYLLNGQEYLELVDGAKKIMGDELKRAFPGYAGQGAELAGLIWFQGVADGSSEVKSADYERNLVALIKDLRKDLNAPKLPIVVSALADSKRELTGSRKTVFDAQMAVGDKEAHPEFADTVISVDTRPACRLGAKSPGGRDRYLGNAESYLEIGDAMAKAMLKLLKKK